MLRLFQSPPKPLHQPDNQYNNSKQSQSSRYRYNNRKDSQSARVTSQRTRTQFPSFFRPKRTDLIGPDRSQYWESSWIWNTGRRLFAGQLWYDCDLMCPTRSSRGHETPFRDWNARGKRGYKTKECSGAMEIRSSRLAGRKGEPKGLDNGKIWPQGKKQSKSTK